MAKQHTTNTVNQQQLEDLTTVAQAMQTTLAELQMLKRKDDEMSTLRLELAACRREIDAWKQMAIEYFEMLQRGIEQYGIADACGQVLQRDASIFARFCAGRGFERITATAGDPLIAEYYQVIDEEPSDAVPAGTILACQEWGYRSGTVVFKRAKVVLAIASVAATTGTR